MFSRRLLDYSPDTALALSYLSGTKRATPHSCAPLRLAAPAGQCTLRLRAESRSLGRTPPEIRADVDEKQLLVSCMALSFFYFSNQYTLGQALGFDLAAPETIEKRIAHVVSLLLDGIRVRDGQAAALTG
jgi:hypothetical protein